MATAAKETTAAKAAGLTDREVEILIKAWKCFKTIPEVDYAKLCTECDLSTKKNAGNTWIKIKKKLFPDGVPAVATGDGVSTTSPSKTSPASGRKRKNTMVSAVLPPLYPAITDATATATPVAAVTSGDSFVAAADNKDGDAASADTTDGTVADRVTVPSAAAGDGYVPTDGNADDVGKLAYAPVTPVKDVAPGSDAATTIVAKVSPEGDAGGDGDGADDVHMVSAAKRRRGGTPTSHSPKTPRTPRILKTPKTTKPTAPKTPKTPKAAKTLKTPRAASKKRAKSEATAKDAGDSLDSLDDADAVDATDAGNIDVGTTDNADGELVSDTVASVIATVAKLVASVPMDNADDGNGNGGNNSAGVQKDTVMVDKPADNDMKVEAKKADVVA